MAARAQNFNRRIKLNIRDTSADQLARLERGSAHEMVLSSVVTARLVPSQPNSWPCACASFVEMKLHCPLFRAKARIPQLAGLPSLKGRGVAANTVPSSHRAAPKIASLCVDGVVNRLIAVPSSENSTYSWGDWRIPTDAAFRGHKHSN